LLTARQLNEWCAYATIEPFGEYRSELRNGTLCALTANINRDSKSRPEPFTATDFMHFHEPVEEKKLTPEEIEQHLDRMFGT
jgi:hypothetical protein